MPACRQFIIHDMAANTAEKKFFATKSKLKGLCDYKLYHSTTLPTVIYNACREGWSDIFSDTVTNVYIIYVHVHACIYIYSTCIKIYYSLREFTQRLNLCCRMMYLLLKSKLAKGSYESQRILLKKMKSIISLSAAKFCGFKEQVHSTNM